MFANDTKFILPNRDLVWGQMPSHKTESLRFSVKFFHRLYRIDSIALSLTSTELSSVSLLPPPADSREMRVKLCTPQLTLRQNNFTMPSAEVGFIAAAVVAGGVFIRCSLRKRMWRLNQRKVCQASR